MGRSSGSEKKAKGRGKAEEDVDAILASFEKDAPTTAAAAVFSPSYSAAHNLVLLLLSLASALTAVFPFFTTYSLHSTVDIAVQALAVAAAAAALFVGAGRLSRRALRDKAASVRAESESEAAAHADVAVYHSLFVSTAFYFAVYGFLAVYALPNLATIITFVGANPVVPAAISAVLPAGLILGHALKLY